MLTALRESGKALHLIPRISKNQLEEAKKENFYCPECKEKVIMKIGVHRMEHFAHQKGSHCVDSYERESHYHLEGKLQLFKWLQFQKLNPILEPYLKSVNQRPDISFTYQEKLYALEYQCSAIPLELMVKRTKQYQKINWTPLWILGGKNIKRKKENKVTLSHFDYLFASKSHSGVWYLPTYCSSSNLFILLTNLYPISSKNALAQFIILPNQNLLFQTLIDVKATKLFNGEDWKRELRSQKMNYLLRKYNQSEFLRELYLHSLNISLLPPFIGLPVSNGIIIDTAPLVWQSYLFIDQLYNKKKGEIITFNDFFRSFSNRIDRKQVKLRTLPLAPNSPFILPLFEYLQLLVRIQVLESINTNTYRIKQQIIIPNHTIQQQECEDDFYKEFFLSF